jgi:phosphatidylserine/phosphatidylglycerophosphate/cardiolipin synthase-like enzyme
MKKVAFIRIISIAICCGLLFTPGAMPHAAAAEKIEPVFPDGASSPVVLLTNENYFPVLMKKIDEAREEIFISVFIFKAGVHKNSYPDRLLAHLGRAAKRGVKVKVILENTGKNDDEFTVQNQRTKKLLEEKGAEVYLDSPRTTTHTKLVVIDRRLVILGSHNFTQSALKHNNEISVLLDRPELALEARNYMLKIIGDAK